LKHMFKFEKNDIFLKKDNFHSNTFENEPLNGLKLIVDIIYG
jgi:hypothetical protein